ncbi:MAG: hypothetical protein HYT31_02795 [Parcubacteria group bacterium]|nr:hypothetical protein [Parcubacteria group bacterium]
MSRDDYCQELLGWNAEHDILTDSCKCGRGYVLDTNLFGGQTCVDGDSYCHDNYGYYSSYDSSSKTCECDYGYIFENERCIEEVDNSYEQLLNNLNSRVNLFNSDKQNQREPIFASPATVEQDTPTTPVVATPSIDKSTNTQPGIEATTTENETGARVLSSEVVREEKEASIHCNEGYALSLNKKYCIQIPEHAHAVESLTDVWLCDDGYREVGNSCVQIEPEQTAEEINTTNQFVVEDIITDFETSNEKTTESKLNFIFFSRIQSWFKSLFR